ncbi:MAG: hypothetical protein IKD58_02450 [Loktanella sp.]|nr:hypothetical protein [Loktanella sp.]
MNTDKNANASVDMTGAEIPSRSVASDIKDAASQKFKEAATEVRAKADGARLDVAAEVNDIASALRRASEELRGGSAQERTLGQISGSLADASDQIRDKDLGELVEMASKVARDNPVLFLSGAALLGFAASRFAKASRDHADESEQADKDTQVNTYMNEGNLDTQSMPAAPS